MKDLKAMSIKIKVAETSQLREISDFICRHFNGKEPIQMFHVRKDWPMDPQPTSLLQECIDWKTMLVAIEDSELVGVLMAGPIDSNVAEKDLAYSKKLGPKGRDIFEFSHFIDRKAKVCERLKVTHSLHVHILSCHQGHLGKGIAKKMFEFCVENGEARNFPAISVDATSHFTVKIAERLGMQCISSVSYDEYNEFLGRTLFVARDPHREIKTYAKVFKRHNKL